ncbi:MAG: hypothetical protein US53_C0017G0007 [Candidatus Woesebacteria bacterium GW2011_GWA1_37_7]|uniref:DUF5667 domain-containing protein n=1 Tax=Candidatus Woesebacteria bacterium GW2011_GWA1_37_7 TaxID=1618545 RepID=A0A0G0HG37_9BACT|nr:MAG: hypothetical protein US53_C0017G0007 [Candidatus Woesebacteria bacterium GW2011_GWA1_37_7]
MWRKVLFAASALLFAFFVLLTSVFRTAAVKYEFANVEDGNTLQNILGDSNIEINYTLAYPGKILPDSSLWPVKALRDKLWLAATSNPGRKAELKLLFADKRLGSANILFKNSKPEIAYTALTKAEKYLEEASSQEKSNRAQGIDTSDFLRRLSLAALKHFEVINEIASIAPEDARPGIDSLQVYARKVFEDSRNALLDKGMTPPENPFNWQ